MFGEQWQLLGEQFVLLQLLWRLQLWTELSIGLCVLLVSVISRREGMEAHGMACVVFSGAPCQDIDECYPVNPCGSQPCLNTVGSYQCNACATGLYLNSSLGYCVDVDECANNSSLCTGVNATSCVNIYGSYYCAENCSAGFFFWP